MSSSATPYGGALAVTGLALPLGWYVVLGVAVIVIGFLLVRTAMKHRKRAEVAHSQ